MAFWYPELRLGYQCRVPHRFIAPIFYWEAVTVASCITAGPSNHQSHLVVYTDNQNTVDIWHSLKATTPYNATLLLTIDTLIKCHTNFMYLVSRTWLLMHSHTLIMLSLAASSLALNWGSLKPL